MTQNLILTFRKNFSLFVVATAFLLAALALAGCEPAGNAAAQKKAQDLFDKWQTGWNTHNVDLLMEVAGEASYWDVTLGERISGEDFRKHAEAFLVAMPDVNFSVDEVTVTPDGKEVIWRWTWTGTFTGPLGETQPTGKKVAGLSGADFIYIEGDKIKKVDIYWNQLDLLTQMGLMGN
ncbi:MAG: ester cyclase [Alphaproteobacteria bacterium]